MTLCDAHCHLANLAAKRALQPLLDQAYAQGITHFLSNALSKSELEYYPQLLQVCKVKLLYSAGIHPNFEPCDLEYSDIEELCQAGKIWAIGEIGLDKGNPELAVMKNTFIRQLDLALEYKLPVVLHLVGHQQEAFDILHNYPLRFLIHGYAGSIEAFRTLMRLDSYFTISERILRDDKRDLLKAMLKSHRFLFETDITQYYVKEGEVNPLLRLKALVEEVAARYQVDPELLIRIQASNYQLLTGVRM